MSFALTVLCWAVYRAGTFLFDFTIATSYPHDAPKVKCKTKVPSQSELACYILPLAQLY